MEEGPRTIDGCLRYLEERYVGIYEWGIFQEILTCQVRDKTKQVLTSAKCKPYEDLDRKDHFFFHSGATLSRLTISSKSKVRICVK